MTARRDRASSARPEAICSRSEILKHGRSRVIPRSLMVFCLPSNLTLHCRPYDGSYKKTSMPERAGCSISISITWNDIPPRPYTDLPGCPLAQPARTICQRSTIDIDHGATIDGSKGPVRISGETRIGMGAKVSNSTIESASIGMMSSVENATVKRSSTGEMCQVGDAFFRKTAHVEDSVLGDHCEVKNARVERSQVSGFATKSEGFNVVDNQRGREPAFGQSSFRFSAGPSRHGSTRARHSAFGGSFGTRPRVGVRPPLGFRRLGEAREREHVRPRAPRVRVGPRARVGGHRRAPRERGGELHGTSSHDS